ncbi:PorT family protein [Aquimarina sp. MMG015]|uniref:porin family protein n=1 Tax=Aquimarina sp. MMG015 TaxID=2822689 RepID=UPI001B3A5855|nr:porin family protein [Aquimarina sp. MMG015]MBQ4804690.1 PorT family protein [Aquimarina sp. MMG015]
MKKVILIIVITVFTISNVNAQDFNLGVKGGLNFATLTGANHSEIGWTTDFNLGIMAEIKISDKFSLQPELMYSGQGYGSSVDSEGIIALNYLNVPLMSKYYVTKGLSLEAGPQIGFLLSTKGGTQDYKDQFKTMDFGVNFGVGYKLDNGLYFSARYNLGLSNINNIDGISDKNRNGVFQLSIGYFFF